MSDLPLLPDQPTTTDHLRRFGPPAAIALAALLFIAQNTQSTKFSFLVFEFRLPLWIMLLTFMVAGAVVAYGISRRVKSNRARAARRAGTDS